MAERPKSDSAKNEGEGNRTAARHYNEATKRFVDSGKVDSAAHEAEEALASDEGNALRDAEAKGKSKARR